MPWWWSGIQPRTPTRLTGGLYRQAIFSATVEVARKRRREIVAGRRPAGTLDFRRCRRRRGTLAGRLADRVLRDDASRAGRRCRIREVRTLFRIGEAGADRSKPGGKLRVGQVLERIAGRGLVPQHAGAEAQISVGIALPQRTDRLGAVRGEIGGQCGHDVAGETARPAHHRSAPPPRMARARVMVAPAVSR